jgi:hypothetical protein
MKTLLYGQRRDRVRGFLPGCIEYLPGNIVVAQSETRIKVVASDGAREWSLQLRYLGTESLRLPLEPTHQPPDQLEVSVVRDERPSAS